LKINLCDFLNIGVVTVTQSMEILVSGGGSIFLTANISVGQVDENADYAQFAFGQTQQPRRESNENEESPEIQGGQEIFAIYNHF
jgi:hypothetical protein